MRLLRPAPGECADRQTILLLKAKYGELKKINVKPFTDEINEIQDYLQKNWFTKIKPEEGQQFDKLFIQLKDMNQQLWQIEDEVRLRARAVPLDKERLVQIALLVPQLNDKRAALVQEINAIFRVVEQEKVYLAS